MWKMNCGWTPLLIHSVLLRLWLTGIVDYWGVEPESWYWFEAGYKNLGEYYGFKKGDHKLLPKVFYGQMILLGAAFGATAYCFEPPETYGVKPKNSQTPGET